MTTVRDGLDIVIPRFISGQGSVAERTAVCQELLQLSESKGRIELVARLSDAGMNEKVVRAALRDCSAVTSSAALASAEARRDEATLRETCLKVFGRLLSAHEFVRHMRVELVQAVQERLTVLFRACDSKSLAHYAAWLIQVQALFRAEHAVPAALVDALVAVLVEDRFQSANVTTGLLQAIGRLLEQNGTRLRTLLPHWGVAVFARLVDARPQVRDAADAVLRAAAPLVAVRPEQCELADFQRELARLATTTLLPSLKRTVTDETARVPACIRAWGYLALFLGDELLSQAPLINEMLVVARDGFLDSATVTVRASAFEAWRLLADNVICWRAEEIADAARVAHEAFVRADSAEQAAAELVPGKTARTPPVVSEHPTRQARGLRSLDMLLRPFALLRESESSQVLESCSATLLHICMRLGNDHLLKLLDVVWRPTMRFLIDRNGPAKAFAVQLLRGGGGASGGGGVGGGGPLERISKLSRGALKGIDLARMLPVLLEVVHKTLPNDHEGALLLWDCIVSRCAGVLPSRPDAPSMTDVGMVQQLAAMAGADHELVGALSRHIDDALVRDAFAVDGETLVLRLLRQWAAGGGGDVSDTTRYLVRRACGTSVPQMAAVLRALPAPAVAALWPEVAARHVDALRNDGGQTRDAKEHIKCLMAPLGHSEVDWLGWRALCETLVGGALPTLVRVCDALPVASAPTAALIECLDVLVECYARAAAESASSRSMWREQSDDAQPRPAAALAQVAGVVLQRAHHSSGVVRTAASALAAATRFVGALRRSADMFAAVDLLIRSGALQLWTSDTRPPVAALDAATCEQVAEGAGAFWCAVLQATRSTYTGAFDSAMLARLTPLLALGLGSRHKNIVEPTVAYWKATFDGVEVGAGAIRELLERHDLVSGGLVSGGAGASTTGSGAVVTKFHDIAKRKMSAGAADAVEKKRKKKQDDDGDDDDDDGGGVQVIDKTNNPILGARVPPPPRSTQPQFSTEEDGAATVNVDQYIDQIDRIDLQITQHARAMTVKQLARLQYAVSKLALRVATKMLKDV